jgi:hypothetical protein
MSINPDGQALRSIVYHNQQSSRSDVHRKRRFFLGESRTQLQGPLKHEGLIEIHTDEIDAPKADDKGQFLPGAALLSCFILICHLFFLEKKEHLTFTTSLYIHYPAYIGCSDKYTCQLRTDHYQLDDSNVTHFFILILVIIGYSPTHILYLTSDVRKPVYTKWKDLLITGLFSTLLCIIHGQSDLVSQILSFFSTMVCLVCGTVLTSMDLLYPGIVQKKWILVLFYAILYGISLMPLVSAQRNDIDIPWFLYVLDFVWLCVWFAHIYELFYTSKYNLQLPLQLSLSLILTIAFWEYGRITDT